MNPGISTTEKEREQSRLVKLSTYIVVDYTRGLVHKIEREIEDLRHCIDKKDILYRMNLCEDVQDNVGNGQGSHTVIVDKDDYFTQMKLKIELLKQEKRRLLIEIDRTVRDNLELRA